MLLIDYLAKLAAEEKIRLDEEERKKVAADQLQDSLVPEMEQRPDYYVGRIYKRKRTPRDVEYVIKNTPEGRVVEYPKKKSDSGTDSDIGQPPHHDEKPMVYDGRMKVNEQVMEKTIESESTSNELSKIKTSLVEERKYRDEESGDDEFYEGQKSIKKHKEEGTSNGISISERILKKGSNEGLNNRNKKIKNNVCNENGVSIREGFWKQHVDSSDEEIDDDDELYHGEKSINIHKKREDGNGFFNGKINKRKEESFDDEGLNKKSVKSRNPVHEGPFPEPGLPEDVKEKICERARERGEVFDGKDKEILVIQKALTASDINKQLNRFSIPENKMKNKFLSPDEEAFLHCKQDEKHYNRTMVDIIEPSGTVKVVPFARWKMEKQGGKPSISYVINGDWKSVVANNGLEVGKVVQLWAARISAGLCFAFVKLD